jgi:hypothetical protein
MVNIVHITVVDSEVAAIRIRLTQIIIEGASIAADMVKEPDIVQIKPEHNQGAEFA